MLQQMQHAGVCRKDVPRVLRVHALRKLFAVWRLRCCAVKEKTCTLATELCALGSRGIPVMQTLETKGRHINQWTR
jgi:hypothetical protein